MADATIRLGFDDSAMRSGLARATSQVQGFERKVASVSKGGMGGGMLGGMAGLAAGAISLGGIKSVIDEFDRLGDLSKQLNQSAESLQRMGRMAKMSGSDLETVAKAMNRLNKDVAQGGADEAFKELGLNIAQFQGLDADKQVVALASAFQRAEANGKGLGAAYDLFGKSAAELLPLLRSNVTELDKMSQAKVVSEENIAKIQEFNDALDSMVMTQKANLASFAMDAGKFGAAFKDALGGMMEGKGFNESFRASMEASQKDAAAMKKAAEDKRKATASAQEKADIEKLEGQLAKERVATAAAEGGAVDKLTIAREKVRDITEKINAAGGEGTKSQEVLGLMIEKQKALREMASAQKIYNDEVKAAADDEKARNESINALKDELQLTELKAKGKNKEAAALEKEMKLKAAAKAIEKDTGATPEQAMALAKRNADNEERIAKRAAGKIMGHKREEQNDFRGLDAMKARNNRRFWDDHRRNPAEAERRKQAEANKPAEVKVPTLEELFRRVVENTNPIRDL